VPIGVIAHLLRSRRATLQESALGPIVETRRR
jgi:hypothetical protein